MRQEGREADRDAIVGAAVIWFGANEHRPIDELDRSERRLYDAVAAYFAHMGGTPPGQQEARVD